ncbi:hypothetical protein ASE75_03680 [Sphingomonas sp. Leaf17]|uniref:hypothetical protein n=1 Tax=Sphingomonas sp. Leaf17 TaxID=1735683 RepID=UPI0006F963EE|nr:hypothetical protein [Sphingomonas sp. Leaf17]KQM67979.1 hypothetical protein ASE75_03680 [Sphingomonas sp. Leaf17]
MNDLDGALARLASAPVPAALDGIEGPVLARIGARPAARLTGVGVGAMTVAALAIGMVGAELPATTSPAAWLAPLGGASPLAPSTLLIDAR